MNQDLIDKYFRGRCSEEELDSILDWFQTQEGRAYLREQIRTDLQQLIQEPVLFVYPEIEAEKIFRRIQKNKTKQEDKGSQHKDD